MLQLCKKTLANSAFLLLAIYFFFLASHSKKFVYLSLNIGPIPVFISDILLVFLLTVGAPKIFRSMRAQPKVFLIGYFTFLVYGFFRLLLSVAESSFTEFGVVSTLKQTGLFYQALWLMVPFLFTKEDLIKLFSVALAGIGFAQIVGWLGFLLMGVYSNQVSKLIGFPVGNEAFLPLYLFSIIFFTPIFSFVHLCTFGFLWLTQFILYMKRNWVFSVFVFTLPLVIWLIRKEKTEKVKILICGSALGVLLACFSIHYVQSREKPIFYHISEGDLATEQRKNLPSILSSFLQILDGIYQNTDAFNPNVSMKQIVFKGDLVPGTTSLSPASTMAFRLHFWKQAWEGFKRRPVIGLGFGPHYAETQLNGLPAMFEGKWVSGPHNGYLAIINRMGLVGGLLFAFIVLFPLVRWFVCGERDLLALVTLASFLSINFFVLFNVCLEHPQGAVWYWVFLGVILTSTGTKKVERQSR